jgi:hypothetical protein
MREKPMNKTFTSLGISLLLLGSTFQLQAQPRAVAPGLWENKISSPEMAAARAQMDAQLSKMPPDQRAQMEKAMAGGGMKMGKDGATQICITPEMAKADPNAGMAREGCTHAVSWSGNVAKMSFSCKGGESGTGEFNYASDKAYSGWVETRGKSGKAMKMTIEAKWLAASCGEVKPIARPTTPK